MKSCPKERRKKGRMEEWKRELTERWGKEGRRTGRKGDKQQARQSGKEIVNK